MEPLIVVFALATLLATWQWFVHTRSRGRWRSPLWMAFSTTAVAALFLVAGTIGYTLSRHARFVAGTAWSDGVIWWEIGVGVAAVAAALYFWRKALGSLRAAGHR